MKILKSFNKFFESVAADPAVKPAEPKVKPGTKNPPKERPHNPIRRDKPSVDPAPKAKMKKESDVVNRFFSNARNSKENVKFDLTKLKNRYKSQKK